MPARTPENLCRVRDEALSLPSLKLLAPRVTLQFASWPGIVIFAVYPAFAGSRVFVYHLAGVVSYEVLPELQSHISFDFGHHLG